MAKSARENMKRLLSLVAILALVISLTACASTPSNTPSESYTSAPSNAETQANGDAVEKDKDGNITKLYHYDGDKNLVFVHEQVWENGRIVKKTSYDNKGNQTASYDYKYDDRGNNTESSWFFWNNGILMKVESKFDEFNRMTETTGFGTESVATNKSMFEYNDSGDAHPTVYAKRTYYPSYPSDKYFISTYEYDGSDNLLKETIVNQDGILSNYTVYTYIDGKRSEYTNYDAEGKVNYTYKVIYDDSGKKLREERYDAEGNLQGIDY